MKHFTRAATALALATAVIVPSGLTAHAGAIDKGSTAGAGLADSCSGKLVKGKDGSGKVGSGGKWELYYSSADGGTNCLRVLNTKGGTVRMRADLWSAKGKFRNAWDEGDYKHYAGAVKITGTKGQCVHFIAEYEGAKVTKLNVACR